MPSEKYKGVRVLFFQPRESKQVEEQTPFSSLDWPLHSRWVTRSSQSSRVVTQEEINEPGHECKPVENLGKEPRTRNDFFDELISALEAV